MQHLASIGGSKGGGMGWGVWNPPPRNLWSTKNVQDKVLYLNNDLGPPSPHLLEDMK
jgi:hypothetical protein